MGVRTALGCAVIGSACMAVSALAAEAQVKDGPRAQGEDEVAAPVVLEWSGRLGVAGRGFPAAAAFSDQRSLASGFVAEPTLYIERVDSGSFTLSSFFRYDHADSRRTHLDLREAYLLLFSNAGDRGWEARLGVGQIFWGVTESQRLVDIVNQVDIVEHPNGQSKLGQPMAHVTWFGGWGTLEVVGMSWHRARTFPGRMGRLRLAGVIDAEHVEYESRLGRWRPAVAYRYSRRLGAIELGVSAYDGTSREPFLEPVIGPHGEPGLVQHYAPIRQAGQDVQVTVGSWLLKAEAIQPAGPAISSDASRATPPSARRTRLGCGILRLVGEWSFGRGPTATPGRSANTLQNDILCGTRGVSNTRRPAPWRMSGPPGSRGGVQAARGCLYAGCAWTELDHHHAMRCDTTASSISALSTTSD